MRVTAATGHGVRDDFDSVYAHASRAQPQQYALPLRGQPGGHFIAVGVTQHFRQPLVSFPHAAAIRRFPRAWPTRVQ